MTALKSLRQGVLSQFQDFGENRFLRFSYAWYFAKYYNLLRHDLEAAVPIRFNLTQEEALQYLDPATSSWNGLIQNLDLESAIQIYRKKYWEQSLIDFAFQHISPHSVEVLVYFHSLSNHEERNITVKDIVSNSIGNLKYLSGVTVDDDSLENILRGCQGVLAKHQVNGIVHGLFFASVITCAVVLHWDTEKMKYLMDLQNQMAAYHGVQ